MNWEKDVRGLMERQHWIQQPETEFTHFIAKSKHIYPDNVKKGQQFCKLTYFFSFSASHLASFFHILLNAHLRYAHLFFSEWWVSTSFLYICKLLIEPHVAACLTIEIFRVAQLLCIFALGPERKRELYTRIQSTRFIVLSETQINFFNKTFVITDLLFYFCLQFANFLLYSFGLSVLI